MTKGPRFRVWALAGSVFAAILLAGLLVGWRANRALLLSKEEVRTEHDIRVEVHQYLAPTNVNFEAVSSPQVFSQFARLNDRLYIAGPAGLAEYDLGGALLRSGNFWWAEICHRGPWWQWHQECWAMRRSRN
jgi:hypothetical protein